MAALRAQPADPAPTLHAQIDRIFKTSDFDEAPRFGPARWLPDGASYAIVERPGPGESKGAEIARYDAATGARTVLVAAARLVPAGRTMGLDIDDYMWSTDGLDLTNTRKVWRENTRGDYWVLDVATARCQARRQMLRRDVSDEASLMFAKFSPDGTRVAYVRANDLYVERVRRGRGPELTRDGMAAIINGTFDWVYEESSGFGTASLEP